MTTATYARFSSEKQREASIDDQATLCRQHAMTMGMTPPRLFSDSGISGATPVLDRPGSAAMHDAAMRGEISVLLLESLDRLSRSLVEQETIVRRLEHRGVRIIGVSDGYDTAGGDSRALARGVRGLINESYLRDLKHKTHRGLTGQVSRGMHAGGLSFGYRSVAVDGGHRLAIDPAKAPVVQRIFDEFGAGDSTQRIAARLNAEGVDGPRGTWCVSALYGSPVKGSGILNNELYVGRYIWNRSKWMKDPDTGKRERAMRPRSEWSVIDRQDLRILTDSAWASVRARMDRNRAEPKAQTRAGARTLFGGLMTCGLCGGAMVAVNATDYGCANRKDRGATVCRGTFVSRKAAERVLLSVVRDELIGAGAVDAIVQQVAEIERETRRGAAVRAGGRDARERALRGEIDRLVDAIARVGHSDALAAKLRTAEAELAGLAVPAVLAAAPAPRGAIQARVKAALLNLGAQLDGDRERAREALRQALGPVVIDRDAEGAFATITPRLDRVLLTAGGDYLNVVAGTRYRGQIVRRIR